MMPYSLHSSVCFGGPPEAMFPICYCHFFLFLHRQSSNFESAITINKKHLFWTASNVEMDVGDKSKFGSATTPALARCMEVYRSGSEVYRSGTHIQRQCVGCPRMWQDRHREATRRGPSKFQSHVSSRTIQNPIQNFVPPDPKSDPEFCPARSKIRSNISSRSIQISIRFVCRSIRFMFQ